MVYRNLGGQCMRDMFKVELYNCLNQWFSTWGRDPREGRLPFSTGRESF